MPYLSLHPTHPAHTHPAFCTCLANPSCMQIGQLHRACRLSCMVDAGMCWAAYTASLLVAAAGAMSLADMAHAARRGANCFSTLPKEWCHCLCLCADSGGETTMRGHPADPSCIPPSI